MIVEISEAKIVDIDNLVSCINTGLHYPPFWTALELKWWFFECPLPVVIYHAKYKGETVGTFAIFKRRLTNKLSCGVLMGLAVKNKWRGKGLFELLGKKALQHFKSVDLFVCFPNIIGAGALEKNLDFKKIGLINTLTLERNKISKKVKPYIIQKIDANTKFRNHQGEDKYLIFRNNETFRKWRYQSSSRFTYYIVSNQTKDFAIIKIFENDELGKKFGDIVDFEMEQISKNSFSDLIETACSALSKFDIDVVTIKAIPKSMTYALLKKMGFKETNKNHYFCVRRGRVNLETIYNPLNWIVRWGDFIRK